MDQVIFYVLTVAFGVYIAEAQEMPMHTEWTLYKEHKNWNEAEFWCELSGGYLANLNTTHKTQVMDELMTKGPWASTGFFGAEVGLHNLQNLAQDPYRWLPGCDIDSVSLHTSYYYHGCLSVASGQRYFHGCDHVNEFICERQRGNTCPYDVVSNKKAVSSHTLEEQLNDVSDEECQNRCDDLGVDCWAAAYDAGQRKCLLYKNTSPFFFDDVTETTYDVNYSMFIKRCYEAIVDSTALDEWILPTFPDRPLSVCSSDHTGRVYTFVGETRNWTEARSYCNQIGQVLAGSLLESDREKVKDLSTHYGPVQAQSPHWVNLELNAATGKAVWADDGITEVSSEVSPRGSADVQCGALDVENEQFWTCDCQHRRAFLCVKEKVPCIDGKCVWVIAQNVRVEITIGGGEATTCAGETTTSAGETTTSAGETTNSAEETSTGAGEATTSAEETSTGAGEATPSAEETSTGAGEDTTSAEETSTGTGESSTNTDDSTATSPTSEPVPQNTTVKGKHRYCACRCKSNATTAPLTNDTQAYARHLIVPPNSTFKNRMRYVSAPDSRPSSVSMGITGIFFLSVLLLAVVVPDLCTLFAWLSRRKERVHP